jgi:hypothetical protein
MGTNAALLGVFQVTLFCPVRAEQGQNVFCFLSSLPLLTPATAAVFCSYLSQYFLTFMEPRNRFQGMNSASLSSLAGRYDNPIPTRFLAPIDCLKIPVPVNSLLFTHNASWVQARLSIMIGDRVGNGISFRKHSAE